MGRHWQNIKLGKGKADSQRAAKFTQLSRAITMAAKEKGGDPAMNSKLYTAIEKAKEAFMPKDNIERAIKRGTGELEAEQLVELLYEGYGAGGAAILVECVTDNRNRTATNVKTAFTRNNGTLGAAGSVAWMFERRGVIEIPADALEGKDPDEAEMALIEAGAEDIERDDEGWEVITSFSDLGDVRQKVEKAGFKIGSAEPAYIAKDMLKVPEDQKPALTELLEALDADEDVKDVYTNADL
ncbi:MAG TPA: YebC/PmpR family DNA-binding transcriptional regulator [Candidatus Baltobacteraceae bacterium]|nr:YebC/PmpR family DNA-binding transcriptional regulator [Candidatus Baltobacteraceae bacterium]